MAIHLQKSRRGFFGWVGLAIPTVLISGTALRAADKDKDKDVKKLYEGVSKKGDLQGALDAAIKNAMDGAPGADRQVKWTLKEVKGTEGGLIGLNEVTVVIDAVIA